MKHYCILIALLILIQTDIFAQSPELELQSIEKQIARTEKLTKNKVIRADLKRLRLFVERVRELRLVGAKASTPALLLEVRRTLYKYGAIESKEFQNNIHAIMKRIWPFLLETGRFSKNVQRTPGLISMQITVPEGVFTLTFPDDAVPGETVSGRIQSNPTSVASLYLLTFMDAPVVADGSLRKWNLRQSNNLILSDFWGTEIVKMNHTFPSDDGPVVTDPQLQVEKQPREAKQNIEIPHLRYQISSAAKAGGNAIIKGPFDGDFSNTIVGVGKYQGHILAESPGRVVLFIHPQMMGDWTILVGEGDSRAKCRVKVQAEDVDPFATLATCTPPQK